MYTCSQLRALLSQDSQQQASIQSMHFRKGRNCGKVYRTNSMPNDGKLVPSCVLRHCACVYVTLTSKHLTSKAKSHTQDWP